MVLQNHGRRENDGAAMELVVAASGRVADLLQVRSGVFAGGW